MKVAIIGNKGGGGKTTVAVHLFYAISQVEECILVDTDYSQRSALDWVGTDKFQKGRILYGKSFDEIVDILKNVKGKNIIIDGRPQLEITLEILKTLSQNDAIITPIWIDREHIEKLKELYLEMMTRNFKVVKRYTIINGMTGARISHNLLAFCREYGFDILALLSYTEYMKIARNENKPIWEISGRVKHGDIFKFIASLIMRERI